MALSAALEALKVIVQKDSSERLQAELLVGQGVLDEKAVKNLSRIQLVSFVVHLRSCAGQNTSVKTLVPSFDASKVVMFKSLTELEEGAKGELGASTPGKGATKGAQEGGQEKTDPTVMFMSMLSAFHEERKAEQVRLEKRDRERDEERKAEQLRLEQERKTEQLRLEKRDQEKEQERKAEQLRLEKREQERDNERREARLRFERQGSDRNIELQSIEEERRDETRRRDTERITRLELDQNKKDMRIAKALKVMRNLSYKMPTEPMALGLYFKNMEELFVMNDIRDDIKVVVLNSQLNEKARLIMNNLSIVEKATYETFKEAILREFRVDSKVSLKIFKTAYRKQDESCCQFATRLHTLLNMYLENKKIGTSFERIVAMLLSDRLRESLPYEQRCYISDKEVDKDDWCSMEVMARWVDAYEAERTHKFVQPVDRYKGGENKFRAGVVCFRCNLEGHTAAFCKVSVSTAGKNVSAVKPNLDSRAKTADSVNKFGVKCNDYRSGSNLQKRFRTNAVTLEEEISQEEEKFV